MRKFWPSDRFGLSPRDSSISLICVSVCMTNVGERTNSTQLTPCMGTTGVCAGTPPLPLTAQDALDGVGHAIRVVSERPMARRGERFGNRVAHGDPQSRSTQHLQVVYVVPDRRDPVRRHAEA